MKRNHKINEELTKSDVRSIMSSEYKSADFKKAVKEISAEVIGTCSAPYGTEAAHGKAE